MLQYIITKHNQQLRFLLGTHEAGGYEWTNRIEAAWPFTNPKTALNRKSLVKEQYPGLPVEIVGSKEAKRLVRESKVDRKPEL